MNILVISSTAAMTSQDMSYQSHIQAVFHSQLPSSFHPLSVVVARLKSLGWQNISSYVLEQQREMGSYPS